VTRDVILTVGLLLAAGLAARVLAEALHMPDILALIGLGVLLGLLYVFERVLLM